MAILLAATAFFGGSAAAAPFRITSPDGRTVLTFRVDPAGEPRYAVQHDGKLALEDAPLGIVREDADFTRGLSLRENSESSTIRDEYEILTAKRRNNVYVATEQTFTLATANDARMQITFRVSNDGVAFRYTFPADGSDQLRRVVREQTTFRFPADTKAWLQPMSAAQTGFAKTNPSYEEHYMRDVPVGTASPTGAGWVFPALYRSGDLWLLVSEAAPNRQYCVTRLVNAEGDPQAYRVGFPDDREVVPGGPAAPEARTPFMTPWRLIAIGSLKTIAESMLGVDLADPQKSEVIPAEPGKSSWSWVLLQDGATVYDVQRRFIDYAADMGWRYCLIDALWDTQIGDEGMKKLADHAREKNVKLLLWYNSNGTWNDAPQTPRHQLLTHESRVKTFDRLKALGIAGLKIDFFGGDGQSMVDYYLDLLDDAAPYGFAMNFHGATLPRGLQRTYPNLLTVEAIKGQEFIYFDQQNADQQPSHAAMLPFTRNVFDPMDFTPTVLDAFPNGRQRRTTSTFELAEAVLFTSGIQHYAEIPEGIAKLPPGVRQMMKDIPSVWDDSKFISGFPGKDVVMARLGNGKWWVAGINGENTEKALTLELGELGRSGTIVTDGDGGNLSFREEPLKLDEGQPLKIALKPHGGFVAVIDPKQP